MKPILPGTEGLNRLEARYAQELELMKRAGVIIDYKIHPFGLRLADKTFYHPDFMLVFPDRFEIHETKGFLRDDANVKIKVAAAQFPWMKFKMVFWDKREGWKVKEY